MLDMYDIWLYPYRIGGEKSMKCQISQISPCVPHMEIAYMIECDMCGDWYHLKCVSLEQFPPCRR